MLFEEICDRLRGAGWSDQLAVDTGAVALTFEELDGRANQLARFLIAEGARAGDRIALLFDQPVYSYIGMLAVLKINAAYVPLDTGFPSDRISYIVADAGVDLVLTESWAAEQVQGLTELDVHLVSIDRVAQQIERQAFGRLSAAERGAPVDALAYVIYTSGSSGRPKGVAIDHPSICNFVRVAAESYGIRSSDRVYQGLTVAFDFSVEEIWVPWLCGATLVPKPPGGSLLGPDLHEFLTNRQVTALCCVPTLLATIEDDLPRLRFLLVSGEACPQDLITRWHQRGRRFLNVYGPTEATVTATWTEVHPDRPVTIGVPLPSYSIVILDADDPYRALRPGEVGEIGIAGVGLARGYVNRPDLTRKAFIPDFLGIPNNPSGRIYRTGDLGRINAEGEIEYHGRIDLQVKVRGYRIELTEIESVLLQIPGIAAAVVDTYSPDAETTELVGYYSLRTDTEHVDQDAIYEQLRERLPAYMVPAYLEHLDAIPMTLQDKADRKNLPPPGRRTTRTSGGRHVAAATSTEHVLADALAKTLRVEQVSVDSDFFAELGANSLLLAQFSARLRKETTLPRISMREIYLNPTIRRLAASLGDVAPQAAAPPIEVAVKPVVRGSNVDYLLCGAAQLLIFLAAAYLSGLIFSTGYDWVSNGTGFLAVFERSVMFAAATFVGLSALPVGMKWLLIGTWKPGQIRLWSPAYLRFWLVKTLIQTSPMVIFAGSPLFSCYLRALGAKIGRGATILTRNVPIATDLITVGAGTLIRKNVVINGYRAVEGLIHTGPVTLGRGTHVGEKTVLDIRTSMGAGAELGHSSTLQVGQSVPAGQSWHGCPAEPTSTTYRTCPELPPGGVTRKITYGALQLASLLLVVPAVLAFAIVVPTQFPALAALLDPDGTTLASPRFYVVAVLVAIALLIGGTVAGLLFMLTVPRLLNRFIQPDRVYPLYGFHYIAAQLISLITNSQFYMNLFGDSSAVVHFLRALGYKLGQFEQTGSNFGTELRHESPFLTKVGVGTMVSDMLSIMNTDYSASSFRVCQVTVGERNYLGNSIAFPPGARTGVNCLLATKVMVPIDGPVRENVGLLGSPPFEIPRSVERDSQFDYLKEPGELRRRLSGKNRHNTATALLYLLVQEFQLLSATVISAIEFELYGQYGGLAIMGTLILGLACSLAISVFVERAVLGFGRLRPQYCSIYDPYFWSHERRWKMNFTPPFPGTPFNPWLWRLAGVRMGRRVFDDGCSIPEKTLVSIGDDATLNAASVIQCHSLEDGTFKSDYTSIGAGATVGVQAFVHYGVTMGDMSVLESDSFLMKGAHIADGGYWAGNPASEGDPHQSDRDPSHDTGSPIQLKMVIGHKAKRTPVRQPLALAAGILLFVSLTALTLNHLPGFGSILAVTRTAPMASAPAYLPPAEPVPAAPAEPAPADVSPAEPTPDDIPPATPAEPPPAKLIPHTMPVAGPSTHHKAHARSHHHSRAQCGADEQEVPIIDDLGNHIGLGVGNSGSGARVRSCGHS
jgi:non-ribosomal peptide synthetase-like protein